jgi:hypothetical protein
MSAGSGASNLGYGNSAPLSNVNGAYVNVDNSNSPAMFGSNEISGTPPGFFGQGLAGAKSNVDAAAGIVPGICLFKGGAKKLKRKIKNITKKYKKMKAGSRKIKDLKSKLRNISTIAKNRITIDRNMITIARNKSRMAYRAFAGRRKPKTRRGHKGRRQGNKSRRQGGGYSQYQNNQPFSMSYSVAGVQLPSSELALANPPPITAMNNAIDNYNHYDNVGFPSRGH